MLPATCLSLSTRVELGEGRAEEPGCAHEALCQLSVPSLASLLLSHGHPNPLNLGPKSAGPLLEK